MTGFGPTGGSLERIRTGGQRSGFARLNSQDTEVGLALKGVIGQSKEIDGFLATSARILSASTLAEGAALQSKPD